ncbi:hypothetical protein M3181_16820 [Mesobacillus maritimus]|uniref:hypothetical protein n=1 Tax=Mesobacillus maritimus TaxID=1643336 RepID=UPI00203ACC30|nr:hypothetical protein [Mesobacillus maritimus]MCM3670628.1 hypothetical protein [Mesobacillus maritimus]
MTAKGLRSFAAGLIVSAGVCGAVYFLAPSDAVSHESTKKAAEEEPKVEAQEQPVEEEVIVAEQPTEEDMKTLLSSSGYVVLTQEEMDAQVAEAVKSAEKEVAEKAKDGDQSVVYKTVLNVATGMTSIDVGKALQQGKIIDNSMDFYREVEKRNLENELRPGTFTLDSEMSMNDVINTIFK